MTWKELKECIDKEVRDDEEIWFIDVSYPQPFDGKLIDFDGGSIPIYRYSSIVAAGEGVGIG